MSELSNYYVTVASSFNRPASVHETTGKELAELLAAELPALGITVSKIEDGDFCQYVECKRGDISIELMVGFAHENEYEDRWYLQVCRKESFFGRSVFSDADCLFLLEAVNKVLNNSESVWDIQWYPHFEEPAYHALLIPAKGPSDQEDGALVHPLIQKVRKLEILTTRIASTMGAVIGFLLFLAMAQLPSPYAGIVMLCFAVLMFVVVLVIPISVRVKIRREADRKFAK